MPKKEEVIEEKEDKKSDIELTQVVTETQPAVKMPNGEVISLNEYLIWLGNQILIIRKAVG